MAELIIFSTLNGLLYGLLLFLMASGLTLIFEHDGRLNFAHASFYMLGAYLGFQISRYSATGRRCHCAVLVGVVGSLVERFGLRRAQARPRSRAAVHLRARLRHRRGGAADLGQARRSTIACRRARFPGFHEFRTNYPAYKHVHAG